mmetsp:Transcript_8630/g.23423  ORF Transcript_8630/g.23423 Transcript_8630/m.23423 type:complete len:239 (-) Transcript_8630:57-773(-)
MTQRQLHQLSNLRHLLPDAANIVIADVIELLLVLPDDRLALAEDLRIGSDDAVVARVGLHDLELDRPHSTAHQKRIPLPHRPVRLDKVRLEVRIKKAASDPLARVLKRQHVHALSVLDVWALMDRNDIPQTHAKIVPHHLVQTDPPLLDGIIRKHDAHGILALLALQEHRITPKQLERLHRARVQRHDRVVVVRRIVNQQPVGRLLALQNGRREVLLLVQDGLDILPLRGILFLHGVL